MGNQPQDRNDCPGADVEQDGQEVGVTGYPEPG